MIAPPRLPAAGSTIPFRVSDLSESFDGFKGKIEELLAQRGTSAADASDLRLKSEADELAALSIPINQEVTDKETMLQAYADTINLYREKVQNEQRNAASHLKSVSQYMADSSALFLAQETKNLQFQRIKSMMVEEDESSDRVHSKDLILRVEIRVPIAPKLLSQEFLVLASQPLTALKDAIHCFTDTNLKALEDETGDSLSKSSSYFYIEGTFYVDMRSENAKDYSEPIIRHAAEHVLGGPPHPRTTGRGEILTTEFSKANMEETTFSDVYLRLGDGATYLYCHAGGCEHALLVTDVRAFDGACDPPLVRHYPFLLSHAPAGANQRRQCEVCNQRVACRVTYDDEMTDHAPFFWCAQCYRAIHGKEPKAPDALPYGGEHLIGGQRMMNDIFNSKH